MEEKAHHIAQEQREATSHLLGWLLSGQGVGRVIAKADVAVGVLSPSMLLGGSLVVLHTVEHGLNAQSSKST